MSNWGVIEEREDDGKFVAYHVMPMITIDGESVVSAAHILSQNCQCVPTMRHCGNLEAFVGEKFEDGKLKRWIMWDHNDPEHPGSKEAQKTVDAGAESLYKSNLREKAWREC